MCPSSFLAVATYTFGWPVLKLFRNKDESLDGWWDRTYFRVGSVKTEGKYGNESVEVHSGKWSIWYMKGIWKLQYELADSRINWQHSTRRYLYVLALLRFDIVENRICTVFFLLVLLTLLFLPSIHVTLIQGLLEQSHAKKFAFDHLDQYIQTYNQLLT